MNDKQKVLIMVFVGSSVLFLTSIFGSFYFNFIDGFTGMFHGGFNADDFKTNYIGLIAVFNVAVSITGFFLFKDK